MKTALDRLDVQTAGGLKGVTDRFDALEALVESAIATVKSGPKTT